MSQLLIEHNLRQVNPADEPSSAFMVRARTLTVLPGMDADRKREVLLFLYEAVLIYDNVLKISSYVPT
jgi:hypothetical protein